MPNWLKASLPLALLLSGCATYADEGTRPNPPIQEETIPVGEAGGFTCNASSVQYALGQIATSELGGKLVRQSGAKMLRWIPPRSAVTLDLRPDRLNVGYDDAMKITRIDCG